MPVTDPPGHRTHQLRVGNGIEVAAQVRLDNLTMTAPRQPVHRAYCVMRAVTSVDGCAKPRINGEQPS